MEVAELLGTLGYDSSPHFLAGEALRLDPEYGHLYRKAEDGCSLRGVYVLRGSSAPAPGANTPVVYVCEAASTAEADAIHRKVWNQNIVPFLIVRSPREIRLYSGFKYRRSRTRDGGHTDPARGVLRAAIQFNEVASTLAAFRAEAIDDGDLWRAWNRAVTPETRVDWKLLSSLGRLDKRLLAEGIPSRWLSHALIGKFVYLHYLRARDILSDRKLAEWGLTFDEVLGRRVRLESFQELLRRLDEWLNGSVFPLSDAQLDEIGEERVWRIAGVFRGDTPEGQQHLDFDAYDFSYIPIETLSVIYQQFLHAAENTSGRSQGRERGAYYTPVPLANFVLDTLDSRKPLREGMRVLDPACGSGVFLVQCYRKLIEQRVRACGGVPPPEELSQLLTNHLFGIDTDPDACQVAELSLILTLLDYVKPPDLTETNFRLPTLRNRNIFEGDAFDVEASWANEAYASRYDWVVGNPPWKELKPAELEPIDRRVFAWMTEHRRDRPVGGNQVAEAFAWRVCDLVAPDGVVGLLLPAMTLFKYESERFRAKFLNHAELWSVANFSNLAEILFAGRSRVPAAAFFYSCTERGRPPEAVEYYSPLVANQIVHDPGGPGNRKQIWTMIVNASEIRDIRYREAATGSFVPWKIGAWGTPMDERILVGVSRRFPTIGQLETKGVLVVSQGLELRGYTGRERLEYHPELAERNEFHVAPLARRRFMFQLPQQALSRIEPERAYVRKGRYDLPIRVCQPPHIVLSAARNFAIYTDEFVVVPARQIGIAADAEHAPFLKALALYLYSNFVTYHQFFMASQFGVQRKVATLRSLRSLPVPFDPEITRDWSQWEVLHEELKAAESVGIENDGPGWYARDSARLLVSRLNQHVSEALQLSRAARVAIHDFVDVRLALVDGQVGEAAVRPPRPEEIEAYAVMLQEELDSFFEGDVNARHRVTAVYDARSAMVEIDLVRNTTIRQPVLVVTADTPTAKEFHKIRAHLREKRSQWVYFDRSLRMYEDTRTYLLKPMQRFHWTESQALADASDIIADALEPAPREHDAAHLVAR